MGQYHNPLEPADRQGIPSNAGLECFADRQRLRGHHSDHELINGCWLLKHRLSTSLRFPFASLANKKRRVVISPDSVNYQITSYTVRGADMKIVALTILLFAHLLPSPQLVASQVRRRRVAAWTRLCPAGALAIGA